MKILILNLTRMGDIIQTSALINGLKKKYANAQIDCLTMSSFSSILKNFPAINKIHTFDDNILINNYQNDILAGFLEIKSIIEKLNAEDYDLLLNLVISHQSSLLSYLLKAKTKQGMQYTKVREQKITSKWTAYHLANEHHLGDHSLNLVDIFNGTGDIEPDFDNISLTPSSEAKIFATEFFKQNNLEKHKVIGFHIGASNSNKAWETEKFKTVIKQLLVDYKIILFGGYKETAFTETFANINSDNFVLLIGKTNLDQLIALMSKIDLLVSNDTGPMHIATSQKIPIIDISLGPVSHWETSPYTDNALVLQADIECHPCRFDYICSHLNCHHFIKPENVLSAIYYKMVNQEIHHDEKVKIWKTQSDCFGYHHLVPLYRRKISKQEMLFEIKRLIWIMTLSDSSKTSYISMYENYLEENYLLSKFNFSDEIEATQKCILKLQEYLATMQKLISLINSGTSELTTNWEKSKTEILQATSVANRTNFLTDYFSFATFLNSGLESDDIKELSYSNINIYKNLNDQLIILTEFLKKYNY